MVRVETVGSVWLIDETEGRYCRFPLEEKPRERAEWGDERAGDLQDLVWHDFAGQWRIDDYTGRLFIETRWSEDEGWWVVTAPRARVVSET
jgi:hypothetical protein